MVNKDKILFIAPLPPPYSGPEVVSEALLNSTLREEFDLIYLPLNVHTQNKDRGRVSLLSLLRLGVLIFRIVRVLIYRRPKLVYSLLSQNFTGFMRDSILIMTCKIFSKKLILHFHGSNFENFYKDQPKFFRIYISFIMRKIDALILEANWLKEFFSQFIPEARLRVIYNPISNEQSCDLQRVDKQSNGGINIFYMSHISVAKGFIVLEKTMRQVIKENKKVKFIIAGGVINEEKNILYGQDGRKIKFQDINLVINEIKKDEMLNSHINFLGVVTNSEEKKRCFLQSDIFVFPSYSEGCPMVILEAMAAGLPLITTPVGALSEIIEEGKNGLFVKIGDSAGLKEKINLLVNDPSLRRQMSINNKKLIQDKFTVDKIIPQFSNFFKEIIS